MRPGHGAPLSGFEPVLLRRLADEVILSIINDTGLLHVGSRGLHFPGYVLYRKRNDRN
jgi:hypothetical protein